MEKRAILAAMLMFGMLLLYQHFFTPPVQEPPVGGTPVPPAGQPAAPVSPTPSSAPVAPPAPAAAMPPAPMPAAAVAAREAQVETPLYRARLRSAGGDFGDWAVKFHGDKAMMRSGVFGPTGLRVERPGVLSKPIDFSLPAERLAVGPEHPTGQLVLTGEDGFGLRITQTLVFHADGYAVDRSIRVENRQAAAQGGDLVLSWSVPAEWPKEEEKFTGTRPIHVVRLAEGAAWATREVPGGRPDYVGPARWIGLETGIPLAGQPLGQNGLFLVALVPRSKGIVAFDRQHAEQKTVEIGLRLVVPPLAAGQVWEGQVTSYIGPMEYERLKAQGADLDLAVYFGGFPIPESWAGRWGIPTLPMRWIAVPVLALLNWVYRFTANYGIAIIVLTVVSKVLFFPLTIKSMRSMKAMQALQPQINALRSKHRGDSRRIQQETMELYRTHGVNPLGGCLPMVVQIPIFYALYVALAVSTEMQSASFICLGRAPSWIPWLGGHDLWICDLAAQDPTYVLPLLMGVTMFIQQKMTPTMGDPAQAKMMLIMPIVFTFFFLNLPAGLVLYWTVSNILQIGQQHYLTRDAKAATAEGRPGKASRAARKG